MIADGKGRAVAFVVALGQAHEAPVACRSWIYQNRNIVERLWARLNEWRVVATRYEKPVIPSKTFSASPQPSTGSEANRL